MFTHGSAWDVVHSGSPQTTATYDAQMIEYAWRGAFDSAEVELLHAECFDREPGAWNWLGQVERHSLGWVSARDAGRLVGWVNVAWDGAGHAFLLDTSVTRSHRRRGVATQLVAVGTDGARDAGCEWMHVDFEPHLRALYLDACGFSSTDAGVIQL